MNGINPYYLRCTFYFELLNILYLSFLCKHRTLLLLYTILFYVFRSSISKFQWSLLSETVATNIFLVGSSIYENISSRTLTIWAIWLSRGINISPQRWSGSALLHRSPTLSFVEGSYLTLYGYTTLNNDMNNFYFVFRNTCIMKHR